MVKRFSLIAMAIFMLSSAADAGNLPSREPLRSRFHAADRAPLRYMDFWRGRKVRDVRTNATDGAYTITPVTANGGVVYPSSIDNHRELVGTTPDHDGFYDINGKLTILSRGKYDQLSVGPIKDGPITVGNGEYEFTSPTFQDAAFEFFGTRAATLGILPGDTYSDAVDVNSRGTVLGDSYAPVSNVTDTFRYDVVLFRHGSIVKLAKSIGGSFGHSFVPTSINDFDVAVGYLNDSNDTGMLFAPRGPVALPVYGYVLINDFGAVAGLENYDVVSDYQITHAAVYFRNRITDVGVVSGIDPSTEDTEIGAFNNLGEAIGDYVDPFAVGGAPTGSFFYSDGNVVDVASLIPANSGWSQVYGGALNDCGDILGGGMYEGLRTSFVLHPVHPSQPFLRALFGCSN